MICPACRADMHPSQMMTPEGMIDICLCGHRLGSVETAMPAIESGMIDADGEKAGGVRMAPTPRAPAQTVVAPPQAAPADPGQLMAMLAALLAGQAPVAAVAPPVALVAAPPALSIREQAQARLAEVDAELSRLDELVAERADLHAMLGIPRRVKRHPGPRDVVRDAPLEDAAE